MVVVAPVDESETPPVEIVQTPVVGVAESEELTSLREYKTMREAADVAAAQATADEALRVAQLALDVALIEPEVEVEPEIIMEPEPEIAPKPDEPPTNDHAFFKKFGI